MIVYVILTLFFITGFLIHHSFLDSRYWEVFAVFCGDFDFSLYEKKIEMDCRLLIGCTSSKKIQWTQL